MRLGFILAIVKGLFIRARPKCVQLIHFTAMLLSHLITVCFRRQKLYMYRIMILANSLCSKDIGVRTQHGNMIKVIARTGDVLREYHTHSIESMSNDKKVLFQLEIGPLGLTAREVHMVIKIRTFLSRTRYQSTIIQQRTLVLFLFRNFSKQFKTS